MIKSTPMIAIPALLLSLAGSALAGPASCDVRVNNTHEKLQECVTLAGVREHQAALQAIADANGGNRVSGAAGYSASLAYFENKLRAAGYYVTKQDFPFNTWFALQPSILEQVSPTPGGPITNFIMTWSGSGDVTAAVSKPANLGCSPADFAGFPAGNIALVQRGACGFGVKATNAVAAGATGVVIYDNAAGLLTTGNVLETFTANVGVVSVPQSIGMQLANTPGLVLRLRTSVFRGAATATNLFAETTTSDSDTVVMAGANLDSIASSPGINGNGSGASALLETALMMSKVKPRNKVRFAWWAMQRQAGMNVSASQFIGATRYLGSLSPAELDKIALYLNFDTIGSPNYVFFIHDGDNSDLVGLPAGPAGSGAIEKVFESFYAARGIPFKGTDLSARSDYWPFIGQGIPVGGITTGINGTGQSKTAQEAAIWGGTPGVSYDPCWGQPCDTFANNSDAALEVNSKAVAFAVLQLSMNAKAFNPNSRVKGNFRQDPGEAEITQ